MKRTAFDERRDRAIADESHDDKRAPCRWCGASTLRETLSHLGARCQRCYDAYLLTPDTSPGFVFGGRDTPQQAEMRRALKANRPVGQAMAKEEDEIVARNAAKRQAAQKVREYAARAPA